MNQFFSNQNNKATSTLEENKVKGKAAERFFASLLSTALDARVSFTSRTEDDSKIDLVTIMSHPWENNKVEIFFTQVKSGPSFCKVINDKLIVDKSRFKTLLKRNHNSLICWTNVDEDKHFWFFIRANAHFFKADYSLSHILSPITKYDLTRLVNATNNRNGGKGLIFNRKNGLQDYQNSEYLNLRTEAKKVYASCKGQIIINPIFGQIEVTRLGWRHISRESRWYHFKIASYEIILILDKILKQSPSKHYIIRHESKTISNHCLREIEYLLSYNNIKVFDRAQNRLIKVDVYVKLLEVCSYLKEWKERAAYAIQTKRRVIFKSIYYKKQGN